MFRFFDKDIPPHPKYPYKQINTELAYTLAADDGIPLKPV
jgi:hypothetical protein